MMSLSCCLPAIRASKASDPRFGQLAIRKFLAEFGFPSFTLVLFEEATALLRSLLLRHCNMSAALVTSTVLMMILW